MNLATFIQEEKLKPLLLEKRAVVVYDAERRYYELCMGLQSDRCLVIDASHGSIESREAAVQALQEIGQPENERAYDGFLVYVPVAPPKRDADKQQDPFASCAVAGTWFPASDGDEYRNLCLAAKSDFSREVNRLFEGDTPPEMATIDALGGGAGWPTLTSLYRRDDARGLVLALMASTPTQHKKLEQNAGWKQEATDLLVRTMGLQIKDTQASSTECVNELWQYVLFSEFVYDLPEGESLPAALSQVPHAEPHARSFIYDICDSVRDTLSKRPEYIRRAEQVQRTLKLEHHCDTLKDLGSRDTFPFEEKTFFIQAVDALSRKNLDRLRALIEDHSHSIWVDYQDNMPKWNLLQSSLRLIEACLDSAPELKQHPNTMDGLISYYTAAGRVVDQRHREFEESYSQAMVHISDHPLEDVVEHTRQRYKDTTNNVHAQFTRYLESGGWPANSIPPTNQFFDDSVRQKLQDTGRKTAVFLIDALRYELGHELQKRIAEKHPSAQIHAYCAPVPSVTPLGMASLLPEASEHIQVKNIDGKAVVYYGDDAMNDITKRMSFFKNTFGDRFFETKLGSLAQKAPDLPEAVDLLIVRSNDIDEQYESSGDRGAALQVIQRSMRDVLASLTRLEALGFQDVYIVTDHGFVMHDDSGKGDACTKPPGQWLTVHDRTLLGAGSPDSLNCVMQASHLGIKGDFADVAVPKGLVPYKAGLPYYHGGASLQELIVPMIHLQLEKDDAHQAESAQVTLDYNNGRTSITTRLPFVSLSMTAEELFNEAPSIQIRMQAHASDGTVVGEPLPGKHVDALGIISLGYGESFRVGIKMDDDFRGPFTLRALNPDTMLIYGEIALETEYMD